MRGLARRRINNANIVCAVHPGTAAESSGLKVDDTVISVDGTDCQGDVTAVKLWAEGAGKPKRLLRVTRVSDTPEAAPAPPAEPAPAVPTPAPPAPPEPPRAPAADSKPAAAPPAVAARVLSGAEQKSLSESEELKADGNRALVGGHTTLAKGLYSKAIAALEPHAAKILFSGGAVNEDDPVGVALATYFSNRSSVRLALEDADGALADALDALNLRPTWVKARTRKGDALSALDRHSEAAEAYFTALEVQPDSEQIRERLAASRDAAVRQDSQERIRQSARATTCAPSAPSVPSAPSAPEPPSPNVVAEVAAEVADGEDDDEESRAAAAEAVEAEAAAEAAMAAAQAAQVESARLVADAKARQEAAAAKATASKARSKAAAEEKAAEEAAAKAAAEIAAAEAAEAEAEAAANEAAMAEARDQAVAAVEVAVASAASDTAVAAASVAAGERAAGAVVASLQSGGVAQASIDDSAAMQAIIERAKDVAMQAAQEAALEAAREVTRKTAQAQQEMMALFAQQQREMLSAVTAATGALESRLAKIEGQPSPRAATAAADVAPLDVSDGTASVSPKSVDDDAAQRAFERMRKNAVEEGKMVF